MDKIYVIMEYEVDGGDTLHYELGYFTSKEEAGKFLSNYDIDYWHSKGCYANPDYCYIQGVSPHEVINKKEME
mgnify:CR=1 FL=1